MSPSVRGATEGAQPGPPTVPTPDIAGAALSGAAWLTGARWAVRGGNILTVILLARLLTPAEYGLVALAKVLSNLVIPGNFGMQTAVIQRPGRIDRRYLDVAWTYDKLLVNSVLAALIFASAPLIASFFNEPGILWVARALALVPLIQMFENYAMVVLTRELDYRRRFFLEAANGLGLLLTVVPLAFLWRNVWAYVVAYLAGLATRAITSYAVHPSRPRVCFDLEPARQLFRFGRWMVGLRLVRVTREQLANVVLGRLLSTTSLGIFHVGSRFGAELMADFYQTAHKVLFPVYARAQADVRQLGRYYETVLEATLLAGVPAAVSIAVLARPLTLVVFGEQWLPAVPVMQILAIAGLLKIMTGTSHPLFTGRGSPHFEVFHNLTYLLILFPLLVWLTPAMGFVGTAWAVLVAEAIQVPVWLWMTRQAIGLSASRLLSRAWLPVALTVPVVPVEVLLMARLPGSILQLTVGGLAGLAVYSGLAYLGWKRYRWASVALIVERVRRSRD